MFKMKEHLSLLYPFKCNCLNILIFVFEHFHTFRFMEINIILWLVMFWEEIFWSKLGVLYVANMGNCFLTDTNNQTVRVLFF